MQYHHYVKLIKPILQKKTNIVYGSRVLKGGKRIRPKTLSFKFRILANHFLTYLSNILNDQKLPALRKPTEGGEWHVFWKAYFNSGKMK